MTDKIWWRVKVYHPLSQSYTWLDMFAEDVGEIEDQLKNEVDQLNPENSWVFVDAEPSED